MKNEISKGRKHNSPTTERSATLHIRCTPQLKARLYKWRNNAREAYKMSDATFADLFDTVAMLTLEHSTRSIKIKDGKMEVAIYFSKPLPKKDYIRNRKGKEAA